MMNIQEREIRFLICRALALTMIFLLASSPADANRFRLLGKLARAWQEYRSVEKIPVPTKAYYAILVLKEKAVRQIIKNDPLNAGLHFQLGDILRDQERFGEAAASYRQALKVDPTAARVGLEALSEKARAAASWQAPGAGFADGARTGGPRKRSPPLASIVSPRPTPS